MPPSLRFAVVRVCELGACPGSEDVCACVDFTVDVDVDELAPAELVAFQANGSEAQRGEILDWLAGASDAGELLAGQRDAFPELSA